MTEQEIYTLLNGTGIPSYMGHAPKGTAVPYIVFNINNAANFGADNVVYLKVPAVSAELYNTEPDPEVSAKIEKALTDAGIYWTSDTADSPEQSLYITYYNFGGLSDGRQ